MSEEVSKQDLELALIGTVGKELRPLSPAESGIVSFKRDLLGISDEMRQRKRDFLLNISPGDVMEAASMLLSRWDKAAVTVVSSPDALEAASKNIPELIGKIRELPQ